MNIMNILDINFSLNMNYKYSFKVVCLCELPRGCNSFNRGMRTFQIVV